MLNPVGRFLGGDVLLSSDVGLPGPSSETIDPREPVVEGHLTRLLDGADVADDLAGMGVRYVLVLHEANYEPYLSLLFDPGATQVLFDGSLDLFALDAWTPPPVEAAGPISLRAPASPEPAVWYGPGLSGWSSAKPTATGNLELSGTTARYVPAFALVALHGLWLAGVAVTGLRTARQRRPDL